MKRCFKISSVILAFSLLLCFAVAVSAAGGNDAAVTDGGYSFEGVISAPQGLPESITAVADSSLSGYKYLCYESEAAFLSDVETVGGVKVVDGRDGNGNSVIVGANSGTGSNITLPTSGTAYVYLLDNVTFAGATMNSNQLLSINLGGKTITFNVDRGSLRTGNDDYRKNVSLNVVNGTVSGTMGRGNVITTKVGATVAFRDVNISATGPASFLQDTGADLYFENCTFTCKQYGIVVVHAWAGNNCSCGQSPCVCDTSLRHRSVYAFKNCSMTCPNPFLLEPSASVFMDVYFDSSCKMSNSGAFISVANANFLATSEQNFHFAPGVRMTRLLNDTEGVNYKYYDDEGNAFGALLSESASIGGTNYSYVVKGAPYKVTWIDSDGETVITKQGYFGGDTPSYTLNRTGEISVIDGVPNVWAPVGWTDTKGGTTPITRLPSVTADATYYLVEGNMPAAFASYESEAAYKNGDLPTDAWLSTGQFDLKLIQSLPEGAYVVLYGDVTYSENKRVEGYKNGLTFDLNGNTFTKNGAESQCRIVPPLNEGETLTFKNGKINCSKRNLVYSSATGGENAKGEIIFENVDVTMTEGLLSDVRSGTVTFKGGSIKASGNISSLGEGSGSESLISVFNIYGTKVEAGGVAFYFQHPAAPANECYTRPTLNIARYDEDGKDWGMPTVSCTSLISSVALNSINAQSFITINISDAYINNTEKLLAFNTAPTIYDFDAGSTDGAYTSESYRGSYLFDNVYLKTLWTAGDVYGKIEVKGQGAVMQTVEGDYPYYVGKMTGDVSVNLSLYTDFGINLYVPKKGNVSKILVNGEAIFDRATTALATIVVQGVDCYVASFRGIAPSDAATGLVFTVYFVNGDGHTVYYSLKYSVLDYVKTVLAAQDSTLGALAGESKTLMRDTLAFIRAAYGYFRDAAEVQEELQLIDSLIARYPAGSTVIEADATAMGEDIKSYILSCRFELSDVVKLRIKLASASTPVSVSVNGVAYEVGEADADGVVAVTLAARDLVGVITIAAGGATGTYSFASYSFSVWDDNDAALKSILTATYAYGKSAKALYDARERIK